MSSWFQVILPLQTNEKLGNGILKNLRNQLSYLTQVYNKESVEKTLLTFPTLVIRAKLQPENTTYHISRKDNFGKI